MLNFRDSGFRCFFYAERLFLKGRLYRPYSFSKGGFNYKRYLKHQGIYCMLSVKNDALINPLRHIIISRYIKWMIS